MLPVLVRRLLPLTLLALLLASACTPQVSAPSPTSPLRPIPTLFPTNPSFAQPTPAGSESIDAPDTGWIAGSNGIELRKLRASSGGITTSSIVIARIDLAQVRLRVGYTPGQPRSLQAWADQQTLLVVNGGFFTEDYHSTALVISDGRASETSYEGFGGMLAVAPSGEVTIQPLRDQPYDPSAPLDQAMQSFPMLVFPGGTAAYIDDDNARARRTAIALDRAGRLLIIVCPSSDFTLNGLAEWLASSDLEIDRALNLDGGPSTGMYVSAGPVEEQIDALGRLPIVLLVEAK